MVMVIKFKENSCIFTGPATCLAYDENFCRLEGEEDSWGNYEIEIFFLLVYLSVILTIAWRLSINSCL